MPPIKTRAVPDIAPEQVIAGRRSRMSITTWEWYGEHLAATRAADVTSGSNIAQPFKQGGLQVNCLKEIQIETTDGFSPLRY